MAFFHPFTNDGGGGERVLWCAPARPLSLALSRLDARRCAVRAVQAAAPAAQVFIYTGDATPADQLCQRASTLFGVPCLRPVLTVRLRCRSLVLPERYPVLTLLGQSLGSMVLGLEALWRLTPELFIDTAGYAFTYPLALAAGARVACYTHYPMVSTDMLSAVASRAPSFNNRSVVARSAVLSALKLRYYNLLAMLYGAAGRCATVCMVNSGWTEAHIAALWSRQPVIVYPPCDIAALVKMPLQRPALPRTLISVAQFRPEKAHALQLRAWAAVMRRAAAADFRGRHAALRGARLVLVGGTRNEADAQRLAGLKALSASLGIDASVDFQIGIPSSQLRTLLGAAHAGLHTMRDEHFGISVVEYMAAGAVPIAHDSGGPKEDILVPADPGGALPGRLACTEEQFAEAIEEVLCWPEEQRLRVAGEAREGASYFSEEMFASDFVGAVGRLLPREKMSRKED